MVTATERAPRASSRRRGAPSGPAIRRRSVSARSGTGSNDAGGSNASARRTDARCAPHQTQGVVTSSPRPRRRWGRRLPCRRRPRGRPVLQIHHMTATPTNGSSDHRNPLASQVSMSPCVRLHADPAKSMQMTSCGP